MGDLSERSTRLLAVSMKTKIIVIIAAVLALSGAMWLLRPIFLHSTPEPVYCTQDAKQCPDGTYVSRTGPTCAFAACPVSRTVLLYYYNPERDRDAAGNILCSRQGLVAVSRFIPVTQTPIGDTIRLLLRGELTDDERAQGIRAGYPLAGLEFTGAALHDSVLTLGFNDPQHATSGGSCRVSILWSQIEVTAKQFSGIHEVHFSPESLFQP